MGTHVPYHLRDAIKRHTVISTDKSLKVFLDKNYQLRIKPKSAKQPLILDSVDVLALANVLITEYRDIVSEARKHIDLPGQGKKSDLISGYCNF